MALPLRVLDLLGAPVDSCSAINNGREFNQSGDASKLASALGDGMKFLGVFLDGVSKSPIGSRLGVAGAAVQLSVAGAQIDAAQREGRPIEWGS